MLAEQIKFHARHEEPYECCGLVSVNAEGGYRYWPLRNADRSAESFSIDPREQYDALNLLADYGHELVAIAHSHPRGTPAPSERDRAFAEGWPGVAMLICANGVVRAYTSAGEPL